MKNNHIIILVLVVLAIICIGLFYIDIPSPSKLIKETYLLEVK